LASCGLLFIGVRRLISLQLATYFLVQRRFWRRTLEACVTEILTVASSQRK